jgi:ribosome-associated protein
VASDKQASDIVLLDVREICTFTDYFVICTADSERQVRTIYEEMRRTLKNAGAYPLHYEGSTDCGWLVIDFGDVVAHIFTPEERQYYQLEHLWDKAPTVVRMQ